MQYSRRISFILNGSRMQADVLPHHNLIELLQRQCLLIGARESCGQGLCGCCTVIVNDEPVSGCLYLAVNVDGATIVTVEGLEVDDTLSDVQEEFIRAGAFQCGYCTPGFILMTTKMLEEMPFPTDHQIKDYLTGNLCRCATYPEVLDAVHKIVLRRKENQV